MARSSGGGLGSRWSLPMLASVGAALALSVSSLSAQAPRWEVDASASRIQFDTAATLNAPSLAGLVEWRRPSVFGRLTGSVTGFENAGWSMQGRGDLSGWLAPSDDGPLRIELAGTGGASRHSSGFDSFVGQADVRLHAVGDGVGGWIGGGGGVAKSSLDTAAVTAVTPNLGIWARRGPVRVTASYRHPRISGESYPEGNLVLALTRGVLDLTAYVGLRDLPFEGQGTESWIGATAAFWLSDRAAVVVSGGEYAADVLQGLPGGDFVSIGFRISQGRARPVPPRIATPLVYTAEVARRQGIVLQAPGAQRVEIAGDFNGWSPEPLRRDSSGGWIVPARLEPGVYRFNLRLDGERWIVPEGVPAVDDGFGGEVGLLIVAEEG